MNLLSLKRHAGIIILSLFALILSSVSVLMMGQALRALIKDGITAQSLLGFNHSVLHLWGLVLLMSFSSFVRILTTSTLGERLILDLKSQVFTHLQSLDLGFYERHRTGDLLTRLGQDTLILQNYITATLPFSLRNGLLLSGALFMLFVTSTTLSLLTLVLIPMVLLPLILLNSRLKKLSKSVQENLSSVTSYTEESFASIETSKIFNHTSSTCETYTHLLNDTYRVTQQKNGLRALLVFLIITMVFSGVCFILWYGGHAVLNNSLSSGELVSFIFYAIIVAGTANSLSESAGDYHLTRAALDRLADLMNHKPLLVPGTQTKLPPHPTISFNNVTFSYGQDRPVLKAINLKISPGETIALVGPTGGGKTTLFKLLLRFYDPTSGSITLGGFDLKDINPNTLNQSLSIVPQSPFLFATSVEENIRYAKQDATFEDIQAAAIAADAHDFITQLPQGYKTLLGERGINLSGGQRQRLALARIILRNPQILLLDEATNALDAETEHRVYDTLKKCFKNKTIITIAHRLSTVQDVDRIVLLTDHQIDAIGTHDELIKTSPFYKRLADLQFIHSNI